jgi:hypothetical protein
MKKASYYLLFLLLFYSCLHHKQLSNYTTMIFYTDTQFIKSTGTVNKIDTDKIKAYNDTIAYKKALTEYYIRLTTDSISGIHTHYFIIRDENNRNLRDKLSKRIEDSLDLLVRIQTEETTKSANFPQLPDSVKPKFINDTNPLLKKIKAIDSAEHAVMKKK